MIVFLWQWMVRCELLRMEMVERLGVFEHLLHVTVVRKQSPVTHHSTVLTLCILEDDLYCLTDLLHCLANCRPHLTNQNTVLRPYYHIDQSEDSITPHLLSGQIQHGVSLVLANTLQHSSKVSWHTVIKIGEAKLPASLNAIPGPIKDQ